MRRSLSKLKPDFAPLDKSFYIDGIEMLERHLKDCNTQKGDNIDESKHFLKKKFVFFVNSITYFFVLDEFVKLVFTYNKRKSLK